MSPCRTKSISLSAPNRDFGSWSHSSLLIEQEPASSVVEKEMFWVALTHYSYLKHKHLAPEEGHRVEVAIADVGFGTWSRWSVPQRWPRGPGLPLMFPLRWGVDPADRECRKGSCGLQRLSWGSWREGLDLREGPDLLLSPTIAPTGPICPCPSDFLSPLPSS